MKKINPAESIGQFFISKYRSRAAKSGMPAVAAQLRKQGVPFEVAHRILIGGR